MKVYGTVIAERLSGDSPIFSSPEWYEHVSDASVGERHPYFSGLTVSAIDATGKPTGWLGVAVYVNETQISDNKPSFSSKKNPSELL